MKLIFFPELRQYSKWADGRSTNYNLFCIIVLGSRCWVMDIISWLHRPTYIHTYMRAYVHTHTHTHIYIYIYIYIYPSCIDTYTHASCIHTYIHTPYMHTYIHTYVYIHAYIRQYTYINVHMHTYIYEYTICFWHEDYYVRTFSRICHNT